MLTPEQKEAAKLIITNSLKKRVLPLLSKKNDCQHIIDGKYIFTQGDHLGQIDPWKGVGYGTKKTVDKFDVLYVMAAVANNVGRYDSAAAAAGHAIFLPTNPETIAGGLLNKQLIEDDAFISKQILDTPLAMNQLGCSIRKIPAQEAIFQYILKNGGSVILFGNKIPPFYTEGGHYVFIRSYDEKTDTYLIGQSFLQDYTLQDFINPYTFDQLFKRIYDDSGVLIRIDGIQFTWGVVDGYYSNINSGYAGSSTTGYAGPKKAGFSKAFAGTGEAAVDHGRTKASFEWSGIDTSMSSYQLRRKTNTRLANRTSNFSNDYNEFVESLIRKREIDDYGAINIKTDDLYENPQTNNRGQWVWVGYNTKEGFHVYKNAYDTADPEATYIHLLDGPGYVKFTSDANGNTILVDAEPLYEVFGSTKEGYTIYRNIKDITTNPFYIKTVSTPALAYYKYETNNAGATVLPVDPSILAANIELRKNAVA